MIGALQRWLALAGLSAAVCAGCWWHGWTTRGDREAERVALAQAERRIAEARIVALAEVQAATRAERDTLRQELDNAAERDPDADRLCLSADSVRRLGAP